MPRKAKRPPPSGSGGYQPAVAATGQPYGQAGAQQDSMASMPLPLGMPPPPGAGASGPPGAPGPGGPPPGGGGGGGGEADPLAAMGISPIEAAKAMQAPDPGGFLGAPSSRPDEGLLTGSDDPSGGPGAASQRPSDSSAVLASVIADITGDPLAARYADSAEGMGV